MDSESVANEFKRDQHLEMMSEMFGHKIKEIQHIAGTSLVVFFMIIFSIKKKRL